MDKQPHKTQMLPEGIVVQTNKPAAMDLSPASRDAMRLPAPFSLIIITVIVSLLLNLLPWSGAALLSHPDFILLILLYWGVHEPRTVGQGWGFALGLIMDVADSALLGQHAMVYVIAIFLAQLLRLRMLQLNVLEQALHIIAILFVSQGIGVLLNLSMGRAFPGNGILISLLLGALLWPIINLIATIPRLRRRSTGVVS
jgi:rod shape-determining protein MreD